MLQCVRLAQSVPCGLKYLPEMAAASNDALSQVRLGYIVIK